MEPSEPPPCGDHTVWWPEVECIDAYCSRYRGHAGDHEDEALGLSWPID